MSDDWKRYVKPCNADGVEHDCMYEFIQGWDVESFTVWLASERARIYAEGYQAASSLRMGPKFNPYKDGAA